MSFGTSQNERDDTYEEKISDEASEDRNGNLDLAINAEEDNLRGLSGEGNDLNDSTNDNILDIDNNRGDDFNGRVNLGQGVYKGVLGQNGLIRNRRTLRTELGNKGSNLDVDIGQNHSDAANIDKVAGSNLSASGNGGSSESCGESTECNSGGESKGLEGEHFERSVGSVGDLVS